MSNSGKLSDISVKEIREQEIVTTNPVDTTEELLLVCTMDVNFKFSCEICRQIGGVVIDLPLADILPT